MGAPHQPLPVKLIIGAIAGEAAVFDPLGALLTKKFGPADLESAVFPFDKTDYYAREMGANLKRKFYSFQRLIPAGRLATIKIFTNGLERRLSRGRAGRAVNIDPGYVTLAKLVLATTKNHSHRLYAGRGIFEEITLSFRNNAFEPAPWTYPDYRTPEYLSFFGAVRQLYLDQTKNTYGASQLYRSV